MTQDTLHYLCDGKVVVCRRVGAGTPIRPQVLIR